MSCWFSDEKRVLVLDKCYQPLRIETIKKSYKKIFSGKAFIIEYNLDFTLKSGNNKNKSNDTHPIPAVIVLNSYIIKPKNHIPKYSRKNIFNRDNNRCAYCNKTFPVNKLTIDHVIPKTILKGTGNNYTNWLNCITSCLTCNNKKADKTPEDAGLKMYFKPIRPMYGPKFDIKNSMKFAHDSWFNYLTPYEDWID